MRYRGMRVKRVAQSEARRNIARRRFVHELSIITLTYLALTLLIPPVTAQESVIVEALPPTPVDSQRIDKVFEAAAQNKGAGAIWSFSERSKSTLSAAPPVPMFLPPEIVGDLAKGAQQEKGVLKDGGADGSATTIVSLEHGYVATRKFPKFDLIVRGTNQTFSEAGGGGQKSAPAPEPDYFDEFSATYSGGQINFGFAGVHYVAEFECDAIDPETEEGADCVSEEEAVKIVKTFIFCNLDGRCIDDGRNLMKSR